MRILHVALALALLGALSPLAARAAIPVHFEIVNDRGETVTIEGAYCSGFGKTTLEPGKTFGVNCPIEVGGQTALQVRTIGGAGVICWPHVVAMTQYRIEAGTLGTSSCTFQTVGTASYRAVLTGASYFAIRAKNDRADAVVLTMTNANCKPYSGREEHVAAGGTMEYRCFRADFNSGEGITIQARVPNNTRDLLCQGWWHERKTLVFHGNCSISETAPDTYTLSIR